MLRVKTKNSYINAAAWLVAGGLAIALGLSAAGCGDGGSSGNGITGGNTVTAVGAAVSTSGDEFDVLSSTLRLKTPHANDVVQSPLLIEGEAGGWYFEGEFPVKLLDASGNEITWGSAIAQGDWMTTDFVPFKATLTFTAPASATGTLVFEASNPRGNGSSQKAQIPVKFGP